MSFLDTMHRSRNEPLSPLAFVPRYVAWMFWRILLFKSSISPSIVSGRSVIFTVVDIFRPTNWILTHQSPCLASVVGGRVSLTMPTPPTSPVHALEARKLGREVGRVVLRVDVSRLVAEKRALHARVVERHVLGGEFQTHEGGCSGAERRRSAGHVYDLESDGLQLLAGHATAEGCRDCWWRRYSFELYGNQSKSGNRS